MIASLFKLVENSIDKTLTTRHHSIAVKRERAEMVLLRARIIAAVFAVLTPVWLIVDWITIDWMSIRNIAIGRLIAAAAFSSLAFYRPRRIDITVGYRALSVLFAIAILFFIHSNMELAASSLQGKSAFVIGSYSYLPFIIIGGIALFPLTALEGSIAGVAVLTSVFIISCKEQGPLNLSFDAGIFWLLCVLTVTAILASMAQLHFLNGFVDQSSRDRITDCYTRTYGETILEVHFYSSLRSGTPLSVVFADLDDFKPINDKFGHDTGDAMLRLATENLKKIFRKQDIIVRWGGEEFVIIMPNTNDSGIRIALSRLDPAVCLGLTPDGEIMTFSLGVSERLADQAQTPQQMLELADQRMYKAKKMGKKQLVLTDGKAVPLFENQG